MALQKRPRFRNVDMRRFPKLLGELGPDYLTEEDYLNVGGPEASAFYREYGKDPLISDLLNRYSFARFGYGDADEESVVSTFNRDAPRFKEGPIREYIPGVIDYDLPEVSGIPVTSIQKLRDQLEMGVEGQGDGAPISGEDNDPFIGYERALERFKSQARKDLVNFKDFLGEEVSEKEREFAFKPEEVDYGDFTPIRNRSNVEYEPSEPLGYVAPIFDENFLPMELPESNFTPVDPDKDLEYTPLEELLNSKAKGGLVGLPIIARSNGGSSNGGSNQNKTDDNNYDVDETGGYRGDQTGPSTEQAQDQYEQDKFDLEDDFDTSIYKDRLDKIEKRNPGIDDIDAQSLLDMEYKARSQGLDLKGFVELNEDGFPSYGLKGPGATEYSIGQIGEGIVGLLGFVKDAYTGMSSMTPVGFLRDILFDKGNRLGAAFRKSILNKEDPYINLDKLDILQKSLKDSNQIKSSNREISDANKDGLNALPSKKRSEVESKAEQLSQQTNISYNEALADMIDDYFYG